jgi:hypothetical protein
LDAFLDLELEAELGAEATSTNYKGTPEKSSSLAAQIVSANGIRETGRERGNP